MVRRDEDATYPMIKLSYFYCKMCILTYDLGCIPGYGGDIIIFDELTEMKVVCCGIIVRI